MEKFYDQADQNAAKTGRILYQSDSAALEGLSATTKAAYAQNVQKVANRAANG